MTEINNEKINDIHFIRVNGEIDAGSSIHLDNAIKDAVETGETKIVVDLTGLQYISSAGLGVFISHLDEFEANKIKLVLFGISESVNEVFTILGLEKLLVIVHTEEKAIASFDE